MSRQNQLQDKSLTKDSTTCINNNNNNNNNGGSLGAGSWHRRSLFSTERLDLILAKMRRNLDRSDDYVTKGRPKF